MSEARLRQLNDEELVALILDGDEQASAVLVDRYSQSLRSLLKMRALQPADIDNLVQETWQSAFRYLARSVFSKAWLNAIAKNAANHYYQKTLKEKSKVELSCLNEKGVQDIDRLSYQELLDILERHMKPKQLAVLMELADGAKPADLARVYNLHVVQIYELRRRAKQEAQRILRPYGIKQIDMSDSELRQ